MHITTKHIAISKIFTAINININIWSITFAEITLFFPSQSVQYAFALFALLQPNTSLGVARVAAQFLPEVGGRNCSAKQGFAVAKRMRN